MITITALVDVFLCGCIHGWQTGLSTTTICNRRNKDKSCRDIVIFICVDTVIMVQLPLSLLFLESLHLQIFPPCHQLFLILPLSAIVSFAVSHPFLGLQLEMLVAALVALSYDEAVINHPKLALPAAPQNTCIQNACACSSGHCHHCGCVAAPTPTPAPVNDLLAH